MTFQLGLFICCRVMNSVSFSVSKKSVDAGLLLTQNEIRAQKDLVFSVTRKVFQVEPLPDVRGYGVSLKMALVWQIRQTRLHQTTSGTLEFNLKLDGRPLAGIFINNQTYPKLSLFSCLAFTNSLYTHKTRSWHTYFRGFFQNI